MLSITIDDEFVRNMCEQKIEERLKTIDFERVFWDSKDLKKYTGMCWNTIQNTFFHDPKFPKFKIGTKWYFPSRETRAFLEQWGNSRTG